MLGGSLENLLSVFHWCWVSPALIFTSIDVHNTSWLWWLLRKVTASPTLSVYATLWIPHRLLLFLWQRNSFSLPRDATLIFYIYLVLSNSDSPHFSCSSHYLTCILFVTPPSFPSPGHPCGTYPMYYINEITFSTHSFVPPKWSLS